MGVLFRGALELTLVETTQYINNMKLKAAGVILFSAYAMASKLLIKEMDNAASMMDLSPSNLAAENGAERPQWSPSNLAAENDAERPHWEPSNLAVENDAERPQWSPSNLAAENDAERPHWEP